MIDLLYISQKKTDCTKWHSKWQGAKPCLHGKR